MKQENLGDVDVDVDAGVNKGQITTVNDLESRIIHQIIHGGNSTFINTFDKTKFYYDQVTLRGTNNWIRL